MDIYESIRDNRTKIESIYDLAAVCYDYLRMTVDNQAEFLAEYIEYSEEAQQNNPNMDMLKQFGYKISKLFLQKDKIYSLDEIVEKTLRTIIEVGQRMTKYRIEAYNEATIAYYLLQAVDLYTENKTAGSQDGPLNEKYRHLSYIYRSEGRGMLAEPAAKLEFRDKIRTTEIRHDFRCIRILEKAELDLGMNPPKMVTLHIKDSDQARNSIAQSGKLKIAAIPFSNEELFKFKKTHGSSFHVESKEQYKSAAIVKALELLEKAICHKANIIIFPEYVCFPELQERIGEYLRETYLSKPSQLKNLLLVVAGSGWTKDYNNVAKIYSYSGKLLGEQYKHDPYDGDDDDGVRWIEGLHNPGRNSVIVEIPKVGSAMAAICRDVSNRSKTEKMADVFEIDFLLVAAWSKSLNGGFSRQLGDITETNITTNSLVCNCCDAVNKQVNYERGIVVTPYKKNSIIEAKIRIIKGKEKACTDCTGCIFSIPLSFTTQDVEQGKIVGQITQNKL